MLVLLLFDYFLYNCDIFGGFIVLVRRWLFLFSCYFIFFCLGFFFVFFMIFSSKGNPCRF